MQAIQISQRLEGKNEYLDKRINKKIEKYKLYLWIIVWMYLVELFNLVALMSEII